MTVLLCILFATAAVAPWTIKWLGTRGFALLGLPLVGGAVYTGRNLARLALSGPVEPAVERFEWMPAVHLDVHFRLGAIESLFGTLVLTVGFLVLVYCSGYFVNPPPGKRRRIGAFAAQMVAFAASMYGLVVSDNILLMFIFWEITSVLSFLLVGFYAERASSRRAAGQALLVTTLGGLVMLVGIILMGVTTNHWDFSALTAPGAITPEQISSPAVATAAVLLLIGALSKSAIAPFHFWLPGAMAAPTPVSSFLHSAAMVKAGVFLVARLAPTFGTTETWHLTIIPLGLVTMIMGGWMALRQKDLKLILAYGTVSQLGFIITVASVGTRAAMLAALALTLGHAMFKATLFMVAGAIDHLTGTRDIRKLSGLGRKAPQLVAVSVLAAASMAGVPPLFGFVAKEAALDAVLTAQPLHGMPAVFTTAGLAVGSILTVAYSLYLLHGAFATKPKTHVCGGGTSEAVAGMHGPSVALIGPAWVLAVAGVLSGLLPQVLDRAIAPYLGVAFPDSHDHTHLALWHGWTLPLALTATILLTGWIMHWQRNLVRQLQFDQPALGSADVLYDRALDTARRLSLRATAATQRGSLPLNEAVILLVLIILPVCALLLGHRDDIRMELWDSAPQGAVALVIVIAALAATRLGNRLSGVIMVGVTGYCLSILFAMYGAPDLALTQLLVETVSMIIFVLVLRTLPARAPGARPKWERHRAWLAIAVGLTVPILGAFAMASRRTAPISEDIPALAKDIGHGANAVNVLLVDIRAWDTFGEISVLVIVAVGIASLVFRTHTIYPKSQTAPGRRNRGDARWLMSTDPSSEPEKLKYPIMVLVASRLLFPAMMVVAAYLFFAGHNAPGGGFAAGLVASLALAMRYIIGGRKELAATVPINTEVLLGGGLLLAAMSAVWPLLLQWPPLRSWYTAVDIPTIGKVSVVSPMLFDLGVFLIVVGTIIYILRSLGGRIDVETTRRAQRARSRRVSLTALGRSRGLRNRLPAAGATMPTTSGKEREQ
nr:Na+/H+ antiporter subunit A [Corynebacterium lactis]